MERQRWLCFRDIATEVCSAIDHPGVCFSDRRILLVYAWAVIHDRPVSWACRPSSWPPDLRPIELPSQPTMSRRLRSPAVLWCLALILERLGGLHPDPQPPQGARPVPGHGLIKVLDGLPLRVGGFSKDARARYGRGAGGWYRGYKLHALWGGGLVPLAWSVRSADISESTEADRLLPHLEGFGYVLGDAIFDCNRLYDAAIGRGHQLIAPKKRKGTTLGHSRQSPQRLHGLDLLGTPYGRWLYAKRSLIERHFGDLTSCGAVSMLPHWVRTPPRVVVWIAMKLIVNAIRNMIRSQLTA
jgi:hypothetical protein